MSRNGVFAIPAAVVEADPPARHLGVYVTLWALLGGRPGVVENAAIEAKTRLTGRVVERTLTDLVDAGLVRRTWEPGPPPVRVLECLAPEGVARFPEGRCKRCRRLAVEATGRGTGLYCPRCKQAERWDLRWHAPALRMAKRARKHGREPNPVQIEGALRHLGAHLWSRVDDEGRVRSGLVRVLAREGLCAPEWLDREALAVPGLPRPNVPHEHRGRRG